MKLDISIPELEVDGVIPKQKPPVQIIEKNDVFGT